MRAVIREKQVPRYQGDLASVAEQHRSVLKERRLLHEGYELFRTQEYAFDQEEVEHMRDCARHKMGHFQRAFYRYRAARMCFAFVRDILRAGGADAHVPELLLGTRDGAHDAVLWSRRRRRFERLSRRE